MPERGRRHPAVAVGGYRRREFRRSPRADPAWRASCPFSGGIHAAGASPPRANGPDVSQGIIRLTGSHLLSTPHTTSDSMRFETIIEHHPAPFEPNEYIDTHQINIVFPTRGGDSIVAGYAMMDYLNFHRCFAAGESVWQIADADSTMWLDVFAEVFDINGAHSGSNADIELPPDVDGFGILYKFSLHPSLRPWQPFVVQSVFETLPEETMIFTFGELLDFTPRESNLLNLATKKGSDVQCRPNMLRVADALKQRSPADSLFAPDDATEYLKANGWSPQTVGS